MGQNPGATQNNFQRKNFNSGISAARPGVPPQMSGLHTPQALFQKDVSAPHKYSKAFATMGAHPGVTRPKQH